jgi:hypothetical protein
MAFAVRGYGMSAVQHVSSAIFHEPGLQADEESLAALLDDDDDDYRELNELRDDAADDAAADAARALAARPGVVLIRDIPFFSTAEVGLYKFANPVVTHSLKAPGDPTLEPITLSLLLSFSLSPSQFLVASRCLSHATCAATPRTACCRSTGAAMWGTFRPAAPSSASAKSRASPRSSRAACNPRGG